MNEPENNNQSQVQPRQFVPPESGERIECDGITYFIGETRGKGHFGIVYDCWDEWGNQLVAKVLAPRNQPYEAVKAQWLREFGSLTQ